MNQSARSRHQFVYLSNCCNTKFLKDFPIDVVYKPNDTVPTQFKSWYCPNLSQANVSEYVINTFENLGEIHILLR